MRKHMNVLLLLMCVALLFGCATRKNAALTRVTLEADRVFQSGLMVENYTYYYIGPPNEPDALLALSNDYAFIGSGSWTEMTGGEGQLQSALHDIETVSGHWDDIEHLTIDYQGVEILGKDLKRAGLLYSRYHWIDVRWGQNNEIFVGRPQPLSVQRGPFMLHDFFRNPDY